MSANAKQHWPPGLSPMQSEAVPSSRAAYSDRTSALMALFCELAHDTFVADQSPADLAGAPTVAGEAGRTARETGASFSRDRCVRAPL